LGSEGVEQDLEDTNKVVAEHRLQIELTKQAVASISDNIADMKRTMSSFIEELRKNYVPRTEFATLEKRFETMEARFWGLLVSVLMLFGGWVYLALK
jgi:predicted  nucleic acid-binding Zn-ribbon protein